MITKGKKQISQHYVVKSQPPLRDLPRNPINRECQQDWLERTVSENIRSSHTDSRRSKGIERVTCAGSPARQCCETASKQGGMAATREGKPGRAHGVTYHPSWLLLLYKLICMSSNLRSATKLNIKTQQPIMVEKKTDLCSIAFITCTCHRMDVRKSTISTEKQLRGFYCCQ